MTPTKKRGNDKKETFNLTDETERIVNELIEQTPRLKAARDVAQVTNREGESIAHRSLRGFRQGLKGK